MAELLGPIDDRNFHLLLDGFDGVSLHNQHTGGEPRLMGLKRRDWSRKPYGSVAPKFSDYFELLDDAACDKAMLDLEAEEATADHARKRGEVPILDQDGLNYCHAYSLVGAMMTCRAAAKFPFILLSAGSIGGPVTGYRNEGAYCGDDITQAVKFGAAGVEFVPMDAVRRSSWKPGAEQDAIKNTLLEYYELPEGANRALWQRNALCRGFCIYGGLDRMSHAMYDTKFEIKNGKRWYRRINSWGDWEDNGTQLFADPFNESYAIRVVKPRF